MACNAIEAGEDLVRLAVVGTNFGEGIARNLARGNPHVELVAVCDLDAEKAVALGRELGVPAYGSLAELFANRAIEAVGLFTPPIGRGALIREVLAAGRHVITTKPFELDLAEAEAALSDAERRHLAVHMNSPAPVPAEDFACIQNWVRHHALGRPVGLRAATWANYREQANGCWLDDPERCPAAPIFRLGIYFLNDFAALLGEPARVHVMQTRLRTGRPTADNAQLSIEFAGGALANIYASFCVDDGEPWRDEVTLNYEGGTIRRWVQRTGARDMGGDHAVIELRRAGESPLQVRTRPGAFAGWYDWGAFRSAVRGAPGPNGEAPAPRQNRAAVLYGVRLLDAMRRSALSGEPVRLSAG